MREKQARPRFHRSPRPHSTARRNQRCRCMGTGGASAAAGQARRLVLPGRSAEMLSRRGQLRRGCRRPIQLRRHVVTASSCAYAPDGPNRTKNVPRCRKFSFLSTGCFSGCERSQCRWWGHIGVVHGTSIRLRHPHRREYSCSTPQGAWLPAKRSASARRQPSRSARSVRSAWPRHPRQRRAAAARASRSSSSARPSSRTPAS